LATVGFAAGAAALLAAIGQPSLAAELIDAINAARARGCGQQQAAPPLRADPRLDAALARYVDGLDLRSALSAAGYRAVKWSALRVAGGTDDDSTARTIAGGFCPQLADPAFGEVGVVRREGAIWIVLAAPFSPPPAAAAPEIGRRVLELTNEARAQPRRCGGRPFAAAGPLQAAPALHRAALVHARDMAARGHFSHTGSDGSSASQRASRAGYRWRAIGENIAAGPASAEAAVAGWLASPGHCANLMNPRFTALGIAYVVDPASRHGTYWVQVFGAPR
jgi:uncharacterized protein YkwD